jgi:hypothetical protein
MTTISDSFLPKNSTGLMYVLQKELENFTDEHSKLSVKNTEKLDNLNKEYQLLLNSRAEFDYYIEKKMELPSIESSLLIEYKKIVEGISEEYDRNKKIILKNNKEISDYYSKVQDIIDTIKHLKSKNYDEETVEFMAKKIKQIVLRLQESKIINELTLEVDKALNVIAELKTIVGNSFYEKSRMCFCDEYSIETALVPCGHTFCFECVDKATKCHLCRSEFTSKLKLYFN